MFRENISLIKRKHQPAPKRKNKNHYHTIVLQNLPISKSTYGFDL